MANPLTKEAAGQPVWAWAAEVVGALVVFRWYRSRRAAAGAAAALGTTSGPAAGGGAGSGLSSASMSAAPANLQAWINSALGGMTGVGYGPTQAFNDITQWLSGGCVSSAGFNALGNAIVSLGTPPGYTSAPAITVCQTNPGQGTSGSGSTSTPAPVFAEPGPPSNPSIPMPTPAGPGQPAMSNHPSQILSGTQVPADAGSPNSPWEVVNNEWYNYVTGQAAPLPGA